MVVQGGEEVAIRTTAGIGILVGGGILVALGTGITTGVLVVEQRKFLAQRHRMEAMGEAAMTAAAAAAALETATVTVDSPTSVALRLNLAHSGIRISRTSSLEETRVLVRMA